MRDVGEIKVQRTGFFDCAVGKYISSSTDVK
jgi:hypothetical protein